MTTYAAGVDDRLDLDPRLLEGFYIDAGFVISLGVLGGWAPMALNVVLTGFEILVCFLQTYVFAVLTCIYLNDALHLEH